MSMLENQDARAPRSPESGVLVSPWIDLQPYKRSTGRLTPARLFALALVRQMTMNQVSRYDRARQNIEGGAARFCASRINTSFPRAASGITAMDALAPGEALVVYADAAAKGGFGVLILPIEAIETTVNRAHDMTSAQRRRQLLDATLAMLPAARQHGDDVERQVVAELMLTIPALILSAADLAALRWIQDGIPALAIAARTERRGQPSVTTMHAVTRFPGEWLGTAGTSGRG